MAVPVPDVQPVSEPTVVEGTAGSDPVAETAEGWEYVEPSPAEEAQEASAEAAGTAEPEPVGSGARPDPDPVVQEVVAYDEGQTDGRVDPGAWEASYHDEYGTDSAAADGSLTQWADGYYIAHDWSESGKAIASGQNVVIDGKEYAPAGSKTVSTDTSYEEVDGWVHADGGIGMQTCTDGGYIVNRYVPVG